MVIAIIFLAVLSIGCFTYVAVSWKREPSNRLEDARVKLRAILHDAHRRMNHVSDPFGLGRRDDW